MSAGECFGANEWLNPSAANQRVIFELLRELRNRSRRAIPPKEKSRSGNRVDVLGADGLAVVLTAGGSSVRSSHRIAFAMTVGRAPAGWMLTRQTRHRYDTTPLRILNQGKNATAP